MMCVQYPGQSPACDAINGLNADTIINEYEDYVRKLARKYFPRQLIRSDELELEIDELVQVVLFKFWQTLMQKPISNYAFYLQVMVRNEVINVVRRSRFHQALNTNEEGEPYYGTVLFSHNEEARDPEEIIAEKETISEYINRVVEACLKLPPLQRKAMFCVLRDRVDYIYELREAFQTHHIDITQLYWSSDQEVMRGMKISASIARKKLRILLMNFVGRKNSRVLTLSPSDPIALIQQKHESDQFLQEETMEHFSTTDIMTHLTKLKEPYQNVLRLHYLEGLSYPQIAHRLQVAEGTVKAQVSRGAKQVRSLMQANVSTTKTHPRKELQIEQQHAERLLHIGSLKEPYQGALRLHYLEGQSYSEVASQLNVPLGTAKSYICRGMKLLQQYVSSLHIKNEIQRQ